MPYETVLYLRHYNALDDAMVRCIACSTIICNAGVLKYMDERDNTQYVWTHPIHNLNDPQVRIYRGRQFIQHYAISHQTPRPHENIHCTSCRAYVGYRQHRTDADDKMIKLYIRNKESRALIDVVRH